MQNSIRTRLAITFVALAASLLLVVGAVLAWQSYVTDRQRAVALQSELALRISAQVISYLQMQENALNELIRVQGLNNLNHGQQTKLLSELLTFTNAFDSLTLLSSDGKEQIVISRIEIVEQLSSHSASAEYTIPKYTGEIYYSSVRFSEETGEPFFFVSIPILDVRTGEVNNVLIANVRFKPVWDLLASISLEEGSNAYIVDSQNRIIAHNNPSVVLRNTLFTVPGQRGIYRGVGGNNVVLATEKITLGQQVFTIVAETPTSTAFVGIIRTEAVLAILLLLAVASAGGLGWLAARQIVGPLEELAFTAEKIAAGDLSYKANISRKDEIGTLGIAFNGMTAQLRELIGSLEEKVEERTEKLEESALHIQNRASQLKTIADIASSIASLQDVNQLLPRITQTISDRFGFYHAGIFLLSEDRKYAVLRSANSEGGQKMLARKHQLRIGQEGIVGFAVEQKRARISLDVGEDAVYFNNPDLPATRSEMALPLIVGDEVIGVLDVQSEQSNVFSNEDLEVLTTLANQVAVAIQNARLFEQSQEAMRELENTFQRYISSEWRQFATQSEIIGYRAHKAGLEPITNAVQESTTNGGVKVPLILRGVTLGSLDIKMDEATEGFSQEEISLVQTIADRLALAMESARLLEDSQRLAAKEQMVGDITTKIGASINMKNVLQTAVEELGRAIPGSEVVIQLRPSDHP